MTLRDEVTSKGGKKGLMRFSAACFLSDIDIATARTYTRIRKLYDLQRVMALAQIPKLLNELKEQREKTTPMSMERINIDAQILELNKLSGQIIENSLDEDVEGGDFEYTEEDVISEAEREELKKTVRDGSN